MPGLSGDPPIVTMGPYSAGTGAALQLTTFAPTMISTLGVDGVAIFPSSLRRQAATYWAPDVGNIGLGDHRYMPPMAIICRWQDVEEVALDDNGEEFQVQSIVYPNILVEIGGCLALGDHDGLDPTEVDALEIRRVDDSPSLGAATHLVKVYL